ncbi:unnamed protein product [Parajaminaea phylloscopi]
MGIFALPLNALHHTITYLYPLYASYKAIASRRSVPWTQSAAHTVGTEARTEMAELEGWLMYWSVVGVVAIAEGWFEWTWNWLPFYSLGKSAFTLWLVLPQTQGATYLYTQYLGPFLQSHEDDIDLAIESARRRAAQAVGDWVTLVWQKLRNAILGTVVSARDSQPAGVAAPSGPTHPQPTMHDPIAGPASQLLGLMKQYAPLAAAGVVSVVDRAAAAASATHTTAAEASAAGRTSGSHNDAAIVATATAYGRKQDSRTSALDRRLRDLDGAASGDQVDAAGRPVVRSGTGQDDMTRQNSDVSGDESSLGSTAGRDLSGSYHLVSDADTPGRTEAPAQSWTSSWFGRST